MNDRQLMKTLTSLRIAETNLRSIVDAALEECGGLLRLAPCWIPRSFVQPGRRMKLHPNDLYAYGLNRGALHIEEDSPKCYSRIRPSCSCEAIWDGIDRTCEARPRK